MSDEGEAVEAVARAPQPGDDRSWLRRYVDVWRKRYVDFIDRNDVKWEVTFGVFALLFVGLDLILDTADPETARLIEVAEIALTAIFFAEFFTRLAAAPDFWQHLRDHFIDAVALIPPVRALRVLRLVRLVRTVSSIHRAGIGWERIARHQGLFTLVVAWLGLGVLCSLALFAAERDVNGTIRDPLDALWWGVGALTTVGSDVFPITLEGRVAAMLLMLLGVFLFSAITATITSLLLRIGADPEADHGSLAGEIERLAALRNRGELSTEEFEDAKTRVIAMTPLGRLTPISDEP